MKKKQKGVHANKRMSYLNYPIKLNPPCRDMSEFWVTAALRQRQRRPRRSSPPGSSRTCTPPPPGLSSAGRGPPRRAGARPRCGPWRGHSGSRGLCVGGGGRRRRTLRTRRPAGRTGSCTDRSTDGCAPSPCCIPGLSHAVRMAQNTIFPST